ncbi:penicillin-binding protein 1A [Geitlerinema sp. PCC 9228]|jgi:penicillin-binding protein 1A|uniref:transglycosylase domain-containing protein n=1 Tax=Geitlerinema sp. PCC 9228 TaxID=111611 RepID=UPI0008F9B61B|nr:penicillin-binding protein 1A [Geitlerinema sp. PCC 9228]
MANPLAKKLKQLGIRLPKTGHPPRQSPKKQSATAPPAAWESTQPSRAAPTSNHSRQPSPASSPTNQSPQKKQQRRPIYRRVWFWLGVSVAVAGTSGATWVYQEYQILKASLPDVAQVLTFARDGTLTIKAADGTILQQLGPATREQVSLAAMPDRLLESFIAAEDRRFYQHEGIDYQAILRAAKSNVSAQKIVQGGSTITQQLARMVFLNQEKTLERKLREAMLARKIEQNLTKEQILERYLNLVYLGSGAYGIADAAWRYFGKPVDKLDLPEMALLAGLPAAPSEYSPLVNADLAQQRRDTVLQRMQEEGFISAAQAKAAMAEPLNLNPKLPKRLETEAPYFTTYVQKELQRVLPAETLERGGLTVETSLNRDWQQQARETIQSLIEEEGAYENFHQGALVAIDPNTGEVRAMIGGTEFKNSEFNRVTQAQRQPGSTFKGIIYTAAIAAGFSPYQAYEDVPYKVDGYKPQNYNQKHAGWVSMADALARSINVVALKVLLDVGFEPTIDLAHEMGIQSELKSTYSLALGSSEVNLLELTNAYATIANQGKYIKAHGIRKVIDREGEVIYEPPTSGQPVFDEDTAAIVTWMLQRVVYAGTGRAAALRDRPVAGKTGTTDRARDLWFIGYVPQLVTGVWLGNDDNEPTWGSSGTAAYGWRQFMAPILEDMPVREFPELPPLENREGVITAKPVEPEKEESLPLNRQPEQPRRRQRRAPASDPAETNETTPDPTPTQDNSAPAPRSTPQPTPETTPVPTMTPILENPDGGGDTSADSEPTPTPSENNPNDTLPEIDPESLLPEPTLSSPDAASEGGGSENTAPSQTDTSESSEEPEED